MSLLFYSIAQASYYRGGGHFIKGGSQQLSNYLAKLITDNSGEIYYKRIANNIIIKNNKTAGVEYSKLNGKEK